MALTRNQWGLLGLGVFSLAAYWYYRKQRFGTGFGRPQARFVNKRFAEAPVVGGRTNGGMRTTLRASQDMPIEERVASIQSLVYQSVQDPEMRKLALNITSKCPERDGECEARAIYDYVKKHVRYTGDVAPIQFPDGEVEGIDLYQSAKRTLDFGGGDCDDGSILVSTLLALNGITPRLRVMKESKRDDWSHILPLAGLPKNAPTQYVPLDTTLPGNKSFGEQVPFADALDFPA